jgi:hypothetical protein
MFGFEGLIAIAETRPLNCERDNDIGLGPMGAQTFPLSVNLTLPPYFYHYLPVQRVVDPLEISDVLGWVM